jgi:hypothetical protein
MKWHSKPLEHKMKFSAWYGISIGTLIILQWILFTVTGSVPEFQTTPWAIGFHMTAELFLALALLGSGIAILQAKPWGEKGLLVALGMAIYSEINSPGYFAQLGQWALVVMFALLLFGATVSVIMILKRKRI